MRAGCRRRESMDLFCRAAVCRQGHGRTVSVSEIHRPDQSPGRSAVGVDERPVLQRRRVRRVDFAANTIANANTTTADLGTDISPRRSQYHCCTGIDMSADRQRSMHRARRGRRLRAQRWRWRGPPWRVRGERAAGALLFACQLDPRCVLLSLRLN